jgi:hypothetical protein
MNEDPVLERLRYPPWPVGGAFALDWITCMFEEEAAFLADIGSAHGRGQSCEICTQGHLIEEPDTALLMPNQQILRIC